MHGSAVIEDEAGIFTRSGAQATPERLQPANFALSWPGVDDAANIAVEPGNQHPYTDDDFCGASFEAVNDGLAFFSRRICSHNLCIYASLVKLNSQKISVVYVDAERDCRQVPAVLQPVLDDIAHQR